MDEKLIFTAISDEELLGEVARRGLEVPAAVGTVAVEAAQEAKKLDPNDIKDSITNQLNVAIDTYAVIADEVNGFRKKSERVTPGNQETLTAEFEAWLTDDKLDYVVDAMEADPELRFTLVATPNVQVSAKELTAIARAFGKDQPYETYVWDELYEKYTPERLSDADPNDGNSVMFSLIPNKLNESLYGTVAHQRTFLADASVDHPFLHVPSPLEAVTYWQTLRATDPDLLKQGAFDITYIRHFNLPEQRFGKWLGVPYSYVGADGKPYLGYSNAEYDNYGRVAVG